MRKEKILIFALDPVAGNEVSRGLYFDDVQKSELESLALQQKYNDKPLYNNPDVHTEVLTVRLPRPVIESDDANPRDFLRLSEDQWRDINHFVGDSNDVGVYFLSHFHHLPGFQFGTFAKRAFNARDLAEFTNELPRRGINWSKINIVSCDFAMPSPTNSDVRAYEENLSTAHVENVPGQRLLIGAYRHPVFVHAPENPDPERPRYFQSSNLPTNEDLNLADPKIGSKQYQPHRDGQEPKVFKEEVEELGLVSKVQHEFSAEHPMWAQIDRARYSHSLIHNFLKVSPS
ncbi:MAG: hypothetical protein V4568_09315 [Pseudomonadota bacterium]